MYCRHKANKQMGKRMGMPTPKSIVVKMMTMKAEYLKWKSISGPE